MTGVDVQVMRTLWLNDLHPYADTLPNLGDRALQSALYQLLEQSPEQVISGAWKAFPWMKGQRYLDSGLAPEVWLQQQAEWVLKSQPLRDGIELGLWRMLEPLRNTWVTGWLDRKARRHTGLDAIGLLRPRLLRRASARQWLRAIESADLVAFNAGGLLADHLINFLPERLFQLYLAKQLGKPVVLLNYSLALHRDAHQALAAPVLRELDLHVLREQRSRESLLSMGIAEERIVCTQDAAFAHVPALTAKPSGARIGIMLRGDREVDDAVWARVLDKLAQATGAEIHFLPNCFKYDPPVRERLNRQFPLSDDGQFPSLQGSMQRISEMDLLITDRYHGVVFAALVGTPVLPMAATTHKMPGLLDALDYPLACRPILEADEVESFVTHALSVWSEREALAQSLEAAGKRLQHQVAADYAEVLSRLRTMR